VSDSKRDFRFGQGRARNPDLPAVMTYMTLVAQRHAIVGMIAFRVIFAKQ